MPKKKFNVTVQCQLVFTLNELEAPNKDKAVQFVMDLIESRLNSTSLSYDYDYDSEDIDTDNHQIETEEVDAEEDE